MKLKNINWLLVCCGICWCLFSWNEMSPKEINQSFSTAGLVLFVIGLLERRGDKQ